nr:MAG TPA: hypothetical protein [Caudoviricetes sp.]
MIRSPVERWGSYHISIILLILIYNIRLLRLS